MGKTTISISKKDFLIPPGYSADSLHDLLGGLRLTVARRGERQALEDWYQQIPLRTSRLFHFPGERPALLYVINPTVGLLDGDGHRIDLHVKHGVRLVVAGQSASRIHPCPRGLATQQWHIRVDSGAELVVLPGPTIPYWGSRYFQSVEVDLEEGAHFAWAEVGLPGRLHHSPGDGASPGGEDYAFERFTQRMTVRRKGVPVFVDRVDWQGAWGPDQRSWHLGPNDAWASLFVTGANPAEGANGLNPAHQESWIVPGARLAPLELDQGDQCHRFVGPSEAVTASSVRLALGLAARWTEPQAQPWLLAKHHLGLNHWFTSGNHPALEPA